MLGVDRRIGSAAQGSSFRLPAEISLCIACLLCLEDNFGVINMPFPPAEFFLWKCSDILCLKLAWQLTGDRQVSCGDALFAQTWKKKAVSEDLGIVSFQTQQGSLLIVRLSTQCQCHMPCILCMNFILQTSGGKTTLPQPHMAIAADCLFPYKGLPRGDTCRGDSSGNHESYTSMRLTLAVVYEESCLSRGNALQPYQHRSAELHGPRVTTPVVNTTQ